MQRGTNLCCLTSLATNPITPTTSIVHSAALDSLMLTDRQGCAFAFSRQLQPACMSPQLYAQPRVKHARLKMRCQGCGVALGRHVHVSVRLCATRGTGERTIGGDKDTPLEMDVCSFAHGLYVNLIRVMCQALREHALLSCGLRWWSARGPVLYPDAVAGADPEG